MTLSDLFTEVADRGWLFNNLYQHSATSWRCNLRTATHHTGFGEGHSPESAIESAIDAIADAIESTKSAPVSFQSSTFALPSSQPASIDLNALLAGLRPPTPPVFLRKL